ncbi:hypothetical protein WIW50_15000 [Flavobacteriaceae bacterium 3-367]
MDELLTTLVNNEELENIPFSEYNEFEKYKIISDSISFRIRIRTVEKLTNVRLRLSIADRDDVFFQNREDYRSANKFSGIYANVTDGREVEIDLRFTSTLPLNDIKVLPYTTKVYLKHESAPTYIQYKDENGNYCKVISAGA